MRLGRSRSIGRRIRVEILVRAHAVIVTEERGGPPSGYGVLVIGSRVEPEAAQQLFQQARSLTRDHTGRQLAPWQVQPVTVCQSPFALSKCANVKDEGCAIP